MKFKYIIGYIPGKYGIGCDGPVLFPDWCDHKETADKLNIVVIKSAGFIKFGFNSSYCYGESVSLDIKSNPEEDLVLIRNFLRSTI